MPLVPQIQQTRLLWLPIAVELLGHGYVRPSEQVVAPIPTIPVVIPWLPETDGQPTRQYRASEDFFAPITISLPAVTWYPETDARLIYRQPAWEESFAPIAPATTLPWLSEDDARPNVAKPASARMAKLSVNTFICCTARPSTENINVIKNDTAITGAATCTPITKIWLVRFTRSPNTGTLSFACPTGSKSYERCRPTSSQ